MKPFDNKTLKAMLEAYKQMQCEADAMTDYSDTKVFFETLNSLKNILIHQGVIIEEADCDGTITSINPDFE